MNFYKILFNKKNNFKLHLVKISRNRNSLNYVTLILPKKLTKQDLPLTARDT